MRLLVLNCQAGEEYDAENKTTFVEIYFRRELRSAELRDEINLMSRDIYLHCAIAYG